MHLWYCLAEIDARTSEENQTPIHVASKYNSASVIPILIEGGARLDDLDYKQRTPLQLAAEYGKLRFQIVYESCFL